MRLLKTGGKMGSENPNKTQSENLDSKAEKLENRPQMQSERKNQADASSPRPQTNNSDAEASEYNKRVLEDDDDITVAQTMMGDSLASPSEVTSPKKNRQ